MARYKARHSKGRNYIGIMLTLLVLMLICCILLILRLLYIEIADNSKQEEISKVIDTIEVTPTEITPTVTKRMLQVKELRKEYKDVKGWLEIEGTNISYPVLQGTDNDFYLTHSYKKEKISGGSLFLDKDYKFYPPSENLLIYGHRNKNGLMLEDLVKYKDKNFYQEHQKIRFTTEVEDAEYEIIGAFNSRVYYQNETNVFRYYYFVNAGSEQEYNDYITNVKKASIYNTGKTATYGDQLLTLSTCDYTQDNGRFAVVAKKVK